MKGTIVFVVVEAIVIIIVIAWVGELIVVGVFLRCEIYVFQCTTVLLDIPMKGVL